MGSDRKDQIIWEFNLPLLPGMTSGCVARCRGGGETLLTLPLFALVRLAGPPLVLGGSPVTPLTPACDLLLDLLLESSAVEIGLGVCRWG